MQLVYKATHPVALTADATMDRKCVCVFHDKI